MQKFFIKNISTNILFVISAIGYAIGGLFGVIGFICLIIGLIYFIIELVKHKRTSKQIIYGILLILLIFAVVIIRGIFTGKI